MSRNISSLKAKAAKHTVTKLGDYNYTVVSGGSGHTYNIFISFNREGERQMQCNCKWGHIPGHSLLNVHSGCSHTLAVAAFIEQENGRKVSVHNSAETAVKQRRPVVHLGQSLYITSRAS